MWRSAAVRIALPGALTLLLFAGAFYFFILPSFQNAMIGNKRDMAKELTATAWTLIDSYAARVPDELTTEEAQLRAIERIRSMRYGPEGKDYFWINDMHPVLVMHPYRNELEGTDVSHFKDVEGKELFREFVTVVESQGAGFVDYQWWWKDSERIEPKLSYVRGFEPWGWVIGTGIYVEDVDAEIAALVRGVTVAAGVILLIVLGLVLFMVWQANSTERLRRLAEATLRANENRFRGIFDSAFQFIGLLDVNGILIEVNETALEFIGATPEQVCGQVYWETPWWATLPESKARLQEGLKLCREGVIARFEAENVGRDGQRITIDMSCKPICDDAGELIQIVVEGRDITEMLTLQEQLRQSTKMEVIGQLAGGIAHDFNNLLAGVMGYAQLMQDKPDNDEEDEECLDQIITAASRGADLTRQLLSFSRKGKLQSKPVNVHEIVGEVIALLSRSIDRRIRIVRKLDASHPVVVGDPTMLQNAILNLGVNARDAMSHLPGEATIGDELVFSTCNVDLVGSEPNGISGELAPGSYLEISIADSGCGMDEVVRDRIFEPFYTTKAPGEGTGLGLAGVFGCVQSHQGAITVESAPGAGSTFRILLPVVDIEAEPTVEADEFVVQGAGHILLVDDEELIRNLARKALEQLGYRITCCSDGREAVEYFRQKHGDVDMVVLDLIMTHMGGEETYRRMNAIDPDVRVLIASGFSRDGVVKDLIAEGAMGFIGKPFQIGELSRAVARIMGAARNR